MNANIAERRIHSLWLNVKGYADKALLGLSGICGTIWGLHIPDAPENPEPMWWMWAMSGQAWAWFVLTILFAMFWALALFFLQRPSYATLMKEKDKAQHSSMEKAEALESALKSVLRQLAVHCNAVGDSYRTTVYFHHNGHFFSVARYSTHPELEKLEGGRKLHQTDQGVIGKAWNATEYYRSNLPEIRSEWDQKICAEFGYSNDQVSGFRMQSRSYAAIRLQGHEGSVGVLVLESTQARGITKDTIANANGSLIRTALAEMVTAHGKFTPRFEVIAEELDVEKNKVSASPRPWKSTMAKRPAAQGVS